MNMCRHNVCNEGDKIRVWKCKRIWARERSKKKHIQNGTVFMKCDYCYYFFSLVNGFGGIVSLGRKQIFVRTTKFHFFVQVNLSATVCEPQVKSHLVFHSETILLNFLFLFGLLNDFFF